MSVFDLSNNKDDVLLRGVIVGLLSTFRGRVRIKQTIEGKDSSYHVPFFYTLGNDERFLQDMFLQDYDLSNESGGADGFYESIPRGIIKMQDMAVLGDELTNRFVRGEYVRETDEGELHTYTADFIRIPLNIPCEIDIYCDTITDQFKISESLVDNVWKNNVFFIDINGIKVAGSFEMADEFARERQMEFGFDAEAKHRKISFSCDVYVEYPSFKEGSEIFAGYTMSGFQSDVKIKKLSDQGDTYRVNINDDFLPSSDQAWPHSPATTLPPNGGTATG